MWMARLTDNFCVMKIEPLGHPTKIDLKTVDISFNTSSDLNNIQLWHECYGHCVFIYLESSPKNSWSNPN